MSIVADLIDKVEGAAREVETSFHDTVVIARSIPAIHAGVDAGKSLPVILAELEPEALSIIVTLANFVFPGAGTAIGVLAYIIGKSHPMTPEEQQAWFEREDGTIRDSVGGKADGW